MNPPKKRDPEREAAMKDAYEQGKTLAEIAADHGLSRQRINQILKRLGVTRTQGGAHVRKQNKTIG